MRREVDLSPFKFIISGGGTGGHIFPAIAIANALKNKLPDAQFLFVGARGRMEMQKVPLAGYRIEGLWISGLQRRLTLKNLAFPLKVISSLLKAKRILKSFLPDAVIGTGGYASGPMLRVAARAGVPTLIQEQNSFPGITNKILARHVDKICVAYDGMERFFPKEKIIFTGNPVRQDILNLEGKRARGMELFGLNGSKKTLLIIGGSLGAKTINESILEGFRKIVEKDIQIIWQTGKAFFEQAKQAAEGIKGVFVADFITRMDYAYAAADLVVSRAGASTVSELCIVHKPCILIPSPNVAEDHQTKNALALINHQAAVLVRDSEAKAILTGKVLDLFNDPEFCSRLALNIAGLAVKNSAELIAGEVFSMINKRKK
ncbi:MAG TPA: undecaprenyldiphospho-muramoylpentapeptide beta-N-acetylglucosaminyltransferase [Bacteroidia bacterium]|nr:undecaprenyldiphospho-muramoylpentapeptide beta-N-acetylglucosaminyltransferase [Bacteroidia bacterium]